MSMAQPQTPMRPPPPPGRSISRTTTSFSLPSTSYRQGNGNGSQYISTSYSTTDTRTPRPGTAFSTPSGRKSRNTSSIGASENHQIICAVSEARGVSPTVGVAFVNISTGEAILSEINDTQFYIKTLHKIQVLEPSKILLTAKSCPPNPKSMLLNLIEDSLPGVPVTALDRRYWSEGAGLEFVEALAFAEDVAAVKFAVERKFFVMCAFCAAIKYLEMESELTITSHSLRIKYQPSEDSMMIDLSTIQGLELIQNLQNAKSKDCLFGLLNHTITPMGSRILRSNILQPSTMEDVILSPRYDAVQELSTKEEMFYEVRKSLKAFIDVERLLTKLVILPKQDSLHDSEQAINMVLKIKNFVQAVSSLFLALAPARSVLLTKVRELCQPQVTNEMLEMISETINNDVVYVESPLDLRNQRTYAVKAGVHGLLDVARKTYKEATDDLYQHVEELNTELNLAGDLKFDEGRRYFLKYPAMDLPEASRHPVLINCVRKKDWVECQTLSLLKFNQRISDSVNEVVMQSDSIIKSLLDKIRAQVAAMFKVCEGIAMVDMLASFAQLVSTRDYVRPSLGGALALKDACHPILGARRPEKFVPNDYYGTDLTRFQIITGCNMSGKSTYIRAVALLQVMAQVGSYVPAQYAAFPVIHSLFSRVSTDDSIEANMSTFSVEMREMAFIQRNINDKSLAIIDELGRGTSTRDGLAIAIAMAEALIQSGALIFFATHFIELAKVLADRPGVLNLHLTSASTPTPHPTAAAADPPSLTMLYKIAAGTVQETRYGLKLARAVGFPARFLDIAAAAAQQLEDAREAAQRRSGARRLARRRRLVLGLRETLVLAEESGMDDAALAGYLRRLQGEFVERMEGVDGGGEEDEDEGGEDGEEEVGDEEIGDEDRERRQGGSVVEEDEGLVGSDLGQEGDGGDDAEEG